MRVRPRTHPPKTSKTTFKFTNLHTIQIGGDLMRAYRKKRKTKNKMSYKSKMYNLKHGRFGGRQ